MTLTTNEAAVRALNRCIDVNRSGFKPVGNLTVSEWATKYRRLSSEASAESGPWRNTRTPYLVDVMDAFTDPSVRRICMVAASQVGKTEFELNVMGYIIDQDPGSILWIHPTVADAKEFSNLRVKPMIRDCPSIRRKITESGRRDSTNTTTQKTYPGGVLTLCGSTEAHALASKPIRYIIGDERDRWAVSAGNEGDPWLLAMARQTTFYNAKAIEVSTPTIKGSSPIAKSYAQGTMERWMSRCPHCGEYHEIRWDDIRFQYDEHVVKQDRTYSIHDIMYTCPGCGCVSTEVEMKKADAKWVAQNPAAMVNGVRSFWLNAFVSQWASWESIILKFLNARGSTKDMQVVYNTCFGELWEDRGEIQDEGSLMARREDYGTDDDGNPVELPEGVLVLTCGIDTQDNRLEYEVLGHGHFGETWGIRKGIIMGRPDDEAVWEELDGVLDHVYRFRNGIGLRISMTFMDEGGHFTQEVRSQCRQREAKRLFCIKGRGGADIPYTSPPTKQKIVINQRHIGNCWQYQIGVDAGKQQIMDNLKVETPGRKYCHFPKRDDYGLTYFNGLLSEHLVFKKGKKNAWQWEKIPGHERNEALDVRNYALAAFKVLPVDLDRQDAKLKAAAGKSVDGAHAQPVRKAQPQKKKAAKSKYFDSW